MIGLKEEQKGYMVYEVYKIYNKFNQSKFQFVERSLLHFEILCNSLSKFEEFKKTYNEHCLSISPDSSSFSIDCYFLVKRKLFLFSRSLSNNNAEINLLFHQVRFFFPSPLPAPLSLPSPSPLVPSLSFLPSPSPLLPSPPSPPPLTPLPSPHSHFPLPPFFFLTPSP